MIEDRPPRQETISQQLIGLMAAGLSGALVGLVIGLMIGLAF